MIDEFTFFDEVETMLALLDAEALPETYEYFSRLAAQDEEFFSDFYRVATDLMLCDKDKTFPAFVVGFITDLYLAEIEKGNADAMNDLGAHYYGGSHGFQQDFEKAFRLYQMAAENGSRHAQENLGYCYYYGRVGLPDYEKAFHYFALGAFDGAPVSLYKIGDMYKNGYYVAKNEKEAFQLYLRCLDLMDDKSQREVAGPVYLRLGKMLLSGSGCNRDVEQSLVCFQRAELFLYDMVKAGDYMYKASLQAAIDGQQKARAELSTDLPEKTWDFD